MIHRVVDAEEAVVGVWEHINGDGAVLRIMVFCLVDYAVGGSIFQNGIN